MNVVEQKKAAREFVQRWESFSGTELEGCQKYWMDLLVNVFGLPATLQGVEFERKVKGRRIDVFYEDMGVLVEQKAPGLDMDKQYERGKDEGGDARLVTPYQQGKWYADNLPYSIRPRRIITCNFSEIRVYDQDSPVPETDFVSIPLKELPDKLFMLGFLTNQNESRYVKEKELSVKAGEIVGRLYKSFAAQYANIETDKHEQRSLNVLLVRLVFLLFAEDSGLLQEHQAFLHYMKRLSTNQMRKGLIDLFRILDTPENMRDPYEDPELLAFPYVNGGLFAEENIVIPQFTEQIRLDLLLEASAGFDWKDISPTIFGAAFESTLNPETRRSGGMHYTSVENIHKVIDPLFLDDLKAELATIEGEKVEKTRNTKLRIFQKKLSELTFLDPAAGSHNFLTETYISLRKLELRVIEDLQGNQTSVLDNAIMVNIGQFYAIEINDFAVSVGKTALWIAEQQMMERTQELLPFQEFEFLPLKSITHSVCDNALTIDWNDVLPAKACMYCYGNPPFIGQALRTPRQSEDMASVFGSGNPATKLDYVLCWYKKAFDYMMANRSIETAFVSTNSICQGESIPAFWEQMVKGGLEIQFAHTDFPWTSEALDKASVDVVIVGFTAENKRKSKRLFSGNKERRVHHINSYLMDAPDIWVEGRASKPFSGYPKMVKGSEPTDDKNFFLTLEQKERMIAKYPEMESMVRPFIGAKEFTHDRMGEHTRYCLWLKDVPEEKYQFIPEVVERLNNIREFRGKSSADRIRKKADQPHLFCQIRQPETNYIIVPRHTSSDREYLSLGFVSPDVICGDSAVMIPGGGLFIFGVMSSRMHDLWTKAICGRLGMAVRYSPSIYNNFVWPECDCDRRSKIENAAAGVLAAREKHPDKTIVELYDPDKMPLDLLMAHKELDVAVEDAYGVDFGGDEEKIVAHLFKLYAEKVGE